MSTEINWSYNCFTGGVHHGRPEAIWQLPVAQAVLMFNTDSLRELVVARIHIDALQQAARTDIQHGLTVAWANRMSAFAKERFNDFLDDKISELEQYYDSASWRSDVKLVTELYEGGRLSPNYRPLHGHDSVNMLCRILAGTCSRES